MGILSDTLLILRKKAGLTQEDVALKLGIPRTYYNGIERGQKPIGKDKIEKLAEINEFKRLGVTYGMLYGLKLADMAKVDVEEVKRFALSGIQSPNALDLLKKEFPDLLD